MAKPFITLRNAKGEPLTFGEMDGNLLNLRDATFTFLDDSNTSYTVELNGDFELKGTNGVSTAATATGVEINLEDTSVTPGSYNKASVTVDSTGRITAAQDGTVSSSEVTGALGYTPEDPANKNTANGYAGLDANGRVASAQLPSFVDDVEEYASQTGFPSTGETGKIYIALDTNQVFRWGGSSYIEIVASPGSTDDVAEGTTNLYFTEQRVADTIASGEQVIGGLTYPAAGGGTITGSVLSVDDQQTPNTITLDDTTLTFNNEIQFTGTDVASAGLQENTPYYIFAELTGGEYELTDQIDGANTISITDPGTITDFSFTATTGSTATDGSLLIYNSSTDSLELQELQTSSNLSDLDNVNATAPAAGDILVYSAGEWQANNTFQGNLEGYSETVFDLGSTDSPTIDIQNGNVQKVTISSGLSLSAFSNAQTGESVTLLVTGSGTVSGTTNHKFAGGATDLTNESIVSIFYDGTNYWTSVSTDYQ